MSTQHQVREGWARGPAGLELVDPPGYASSALGVIDAVFSIRASYSATRNVVTRYASHHDVVDIGFLPNNPDDHDLVALRDNLTNQSDQQLIDLFGSAQHTGRRLKATAVRDAAINLVAAGIRNRADLASLDNDPDQRRQAAAAWTGVVGLGDATWRYLRILMGSQDVKPDRMILGWLQGVLGYRPSTGEAVELVAELAEQLNQPQRVVEHAIWRYQSKRRS